MNSIQRRNVSASLGDAVTVAVFAGAGAESTLLSSASIEADFVVKSVPERLRGPSGSPPGHRLLLPLTPMWQLLFRFEIIGIV